MTDVLAADAVRCAVLTRARLLAEWLANGRPVTAKDVLRPVDVPAAASAMKVQVPARTRTAADIEILHWPWTAARATGLITIGGGRAAAAAPATSAGHLESWWTALLAVLAVESHDRRGEGATVLCRALLAALASEPAPAAGDLEVAVREQLDQEDLRRQGAVYEAFRRGLMPVEGGLAVLAAFGAVDQMGRITALGRWASGRFAASTPQPVRSDLPAAELLARVAKLPRDDAWHTYVRWLDDQDLDKAVTAVLAAAAAGTPAQRIAGINLAAGLGEAAVPALMAALDQPMLASQVRPLLVAWGEHEHGTEEAAETDRRWLAVDYALAAEDPEEMYHLVQEAGGTAEIEASSHPEADRLLAALAAFGRPVLRAYQLKIALVRSRPAIWRRLVLPAATTLDVLHFAIQVAFDWDDDHLHSFDTGNQRYADLEFRLEECDDEADARLAKVLSHVGATMTYVYDLGDWWEHKITVERILEPDDRTAIACTGGLGDAPIEDWNPEDGAGTTPFDLDSINRRLAELT